MTDKTYDIQELTNESGVPRRTVYFYVQQGVLPPPDGAGLAARYSEDHLLRLRLIPVLRGQGLRLDEIRARFAQMSAEEMRAVLASAKQPSPVPHPALAPAAAPRAIRELPGVWSPVEGQRYIHYHLPSGISLAAPENLSPADQQRLEQLLKAARQIFANGPTMALDSTSWSGDEPSNV